MKHSHAPAATPLLLRTKQLETLVQVPSVVPL
jgi:hypothetical protein